MVIKITKQSKRGIAVLAILLCAVMVLAMLFLTRCVKNNPEQDMTVSIIDVGQGSATLIISEGKVLLVDAGKSGAGGTVVAHLKSAGVSEIDYLVATHPDADHIGGMPAVLDAFQVENITYPIPENNTDTYKLFVNKVNAEPGATIAHPKTGEQYYLGDAIVTVLYDGDDAKYDPAKDYDTNRASIVLRVDCGAKSMLLMGDYLGEMEEYLIANQTSDKNLSLSSDVLQVAHHGSKYSTTDNFLVVVHPSIAVISVGTGGYRYGHPDAGVLERLSLLPVTTYRTDLDGTIRLRFVDDKITVSAEKQTALDKAA